MNAEAPLELFHQGAEYRLAMPTPKSPAEIIYLPYRRPHCTIRVVLSHEPPPFETYSPRAEYKVRASPDPSKPARLE